MKKVLSVALVLSIILALGHAAYSLHWILWSNFSDIFRKECISMV